MIENAIHPINESDIIFLGLDYYGTCGKQGKGPSLIRNALNSLSSYNPLNGQDCFDVLRLCDAGDIKTNDFNELREKVLGKLDFKGMPLIIGGEHLVTLPVIESLKPKNVLIFDAHADFYDEYKGDKYSYATVTRRISELVDRVVIAGVRDLTQVEAKALKNAKNVELISVEEVPERVTSGEWYVSIDLDVLDPVYCPEVSTPVPFGVNLRTLVKVLNKVCFNHRIKGLDVVELTAKNNGLSSVNAGGIIMNYLKRRCG